MAPPCLTLTLFVCVAITSFVCVNANTFLPDPLPYNGDINNDGIPDNEVVQWASWLVQYDDHDYFVALTREFAILFSAIHDGLNLIKPVYTKYFDLDKMNIMMDKNCIANANSDAFVTSAAYNGWIYIIYSRLSTLNVSLPAYNASTQAWLSSAATNFYNSRLSVINASAGNSKRAAKSLSDGIILGQKIVLGSFGARSNDGWNTAAPQYDPVHFDPNNPNNGYVPGQWYSYPAPKLFGESQWPNVKTFTAPNNQTFAVGPPISFDSQEFEVQLNITKLLGGASPSSPNRATAAQQGSAKWWNVASVSQHGSLIAGNMVSNLGWNLQDSARALALVHLTIADCMITNIADKFRFNAWRPYQALLIGGFSVIQPLLDSSWVPYLVTPDSPEYPAGHPTHGTGAAMALKLIFGFNTFSKNITIQYDGTIPAQTFASFQDVSTQVINARIYGGMHFLTSCRAGAAAGSEIATNAVASFLKPLQKREQCY